MLIACESKEKKANFIAIEMVDSICHFSVNAFIKKHLETGEKKCSDTLSATDITDKTQNYDQGNAKLFGC